MENKKLIIKIIVKLVFAVLFLVSVVKIVLM